MLSAWGSWGGAREDIRPVCEKAQSGAAGRKSGIAARDEPCPWAVLRVWI